MNERTKQEDWRLFARYIAGECSSREAKYVREIVETDRDTAELLNEIRRIWFLSHDEDEPVDLAKSWGELDRRIAREFGSRRFSVARNDHLDASETDRRPVQRRRTRRSTGRHLLRTGASLLAVVAVAIFVVRYVSPPPPDAGDPAVESRMNTFRAERGYRSTVRLTDGSTVQLNSGSELRVPKQFAEDRRVQLDGEAFFDVAKDSTRPFLVQTSSATVEVLGTAFSVRAYSNDGEVTVAVSRGKVALMSDDVARRDTVILGARDVGIVSRGRRHVVQHHAPLDQHLGWTEGRLVFRNSTFDDVATELERWYDLDVNLVGADETADGLTASFDDEPLDQILESISIALSLKYERDDDKVMFYADRRTISK